MNAGLLRSAWHPVSSSAPRFFTPTFGKPGAAAELPSPDRGVEGAILSAGGVSSHKVLYDRLLAKLNEHIPEQYRDSDGVLTAEEYSPENVAARILGFVRGGIARAAGDDGEKTAAMLDQARAGIERGFGEARDILNGLGVFSGAVAENANRTYDLLQQGMDELSAELLAGNSANAAVRSVDARSASGQTADVELVTREGDRVRLSISLSSSEQLSWRQDSASLQASYSQSRQADLNFSVEGDLNADEQRAIGNLLQRVDELAQRFYGGDLRGTIDRALALTDHMDQMSELSVTLTTQATRAVSAYQQQPVAPDHVAVPAPRPWANELREIVDQAQASFGLSDAGSALKALFDAVMTVRYGANDDDNVNKTMSGIGKLIDATARMPD